LQLLWTVLLLASQFWQIARQMTTLEVTNLGRYGFMGGRAGANLNSQMGHRQQHMRSANLVGTDTNGDVSPEEGLVGEASPALGHGHEHVHGHHKSGLCAGCGGGFLMLYCPDGTKAGIRSALTAEGLREMPFNFDLDGAKIVVNF